jgi:hypothetical protein
MEVQIAPPLMFRVIMAVRNRKSMIPLEARSAEIPNHINSKTLHIQLIYNNNNNNNNNNTIIMNINKTISVNLEVNVKLMVTLESDFADTNKLLKSVQVSSIS